MHWRQGCIIYIPLDYKKYTPLDDGLPGVVTLLTNEIPLQFTAVDLQTRKYSSHEIFNNPNVGQI